MPFKRDWGYRGFTLVELLVVIAILGILASIAVVAIGRIIENSREQICHVNRIEVMKMYKTHLEVDEAEQTEQGFREFMHQYGETVCPSGGEIKFVDDEVRCSIHGGEGGDSEDDEGEVPYL